MYIAFKGGRSENVALLITPSSTTRNVQRQVREVTVGIMMYIYNTKEYVVLGSGRSGFGFVATMNFIFDINKMINGLKNVLIITWHHLGIRHQ